MTTSADREVFMVNRGLMLAGLLMAALFFFSSWFSVRVEGSLVEVRGFQIGFIAERLMEGQVRYRWIFRFIQFLPLFLAGLAGLYLWHKSFNNKTLLRSITVFSTISIIYLINLKSSADRLPQVTSVNWGMFAVFLGIVCLLCGSIYSLRDKTFDG